MIKSSQALTDFAMISERYRKNFSEKLRKSLSKSDLQKNQIYELAQNKRLSDIQYELAEGKLNMIFDSVSAISNAKKLEDKYQFEIDQLLSTQRTLQSEKIDLDQAIGKLMKERDQFRDDVKDMSEAKQRLEKEKNFYTI